MLGQAHLVGQAPARGATYAGAGVDIRAGELAVERIRRLVGSTARPEVIGGIGGFGGCFAFDQGGWRSPVLVASTDGVGTKAIVAQSAGRYGTIGVDLVAMCVDDIVCVGAQALFLLDYIATGRLDPDQVEQLVSGVADGCRQAGCSLLGGEMAEHPGAMPAGSFDLAGFAVGVVERSEMLGPERVEPGDLLVGIASPGLRCNGYSLARHVLFELAGRSLDSPAWDGSESTLADELLLPSVVYMPAVLAAVAASTVHAAAHVTGGGIASNLARVLPEGCGAVVERGSWEVPRIFDEIGQAGQVSQEEMERVFNLGLGMVLVVGASSAPDAIAAIEEHGHKAAIVGMVEAGSGARLEGSR